MLDWMGRAGCLGMVDGMWDDGVPSADALRVCFRCPVIRTCAEYGIDRVFASDAGVLGGLGVQDRDRVRTGEVTLEVAWERRRRWLVAVDWEAAKDEDLIRSGVFA
jgi:hypothetical protein